ncbi:MAG TPA: PQQ-binding-like beta-propeller repeat protein [Terriglobia bacterium]|nr:PQQ-binding-like beta-propeller repeat protein [Terriglobia bacterium]
MTVDRCLRIPLLLIFLLGTRCLWAGDWPTFAHDPQRTGWASDEKTLSLSNVGDLELKWKVHVNNEPKALTSLTAPVVASGVATQTGVKTIVYVAGSSNHLFALDAGSGKLIWSREFESYAKPVNPDFWLCPQGINATPVIDKSTRTIYEIAMDGRLFGLDLGTAAVKFGPTQFVPPFSKNWSLNLVDGEVYTSTSQGCGGAQSGIYSMDIRDPLRPFTREFLVLEQGGGIWGRGGPAIGLDDRIFVATGDGLSDPARGEFGSSVVAATSGDLGLADYFMPRNSDYLTKEDLDFGSGSPVWFRYRNYKLICVGGKEGVLYMLDASSLGGKDHHTPLAATAMLANDSANFEGEGIWGAPSIWKDMSRRETWVYVPVWGPISKHAPRFPVTHGDHPHGCIMAFKVTMSVVSLAHADSRYQQKNEDNLGPRPLGGGAQRRVRGSVRNFGTWPTLQPVWISGDFNLPEPVAIANGVVFALSTGENPNQVTADSGTPAHPGYTILTNAQRTQNTAHAILYALDARTGKELYNSGDAITGWTHFSGLAVADGRVYVVDHDSNVYCFGLPSERERNASHGRN